MGLFSLILSENQVSEFAKKLTLHFEDYMCRIDGVILKAMYKKYGREALDLIKKTVYDLGYSDGVSYRKAEKLDPDEIDCKKVAEIFNEWNAVFKHTGDRYSFPRVSRDSCEMRWDLCQGSEFFLTALDDKDKTKISLCEFIAGPYDWGFVKGLSDNLRVTAYPGLRGRKGWPWQPCKIVVKRVAKKSKSLENKRTR
jgi:hypothetical protein